MRDWRIPVRFLSGVLETAIIIQQAAGSGGGRAVVG